MSHPSHLIERQWYRFFACAGVALLLGALALPALVEQSPTVFAQGTQAQRPLDGVSNAIMTDSPAVVRIVEGVSAVLTWHTTQGDIVSPDPNSSANSFSYGVAGSGAFITPDGYVLTADHVVDHSMNNPEDVAFVEQSAAQDIAQRVGGGVTSDQIFSLLQQDASSVSIQFTVTFQKVFLSTDYTGALSSATQVQAFDITSTSASSPVEQQDTAIIKVSLQGISDVPYLGLAAPNSINVGDTVTAIAYPADADYALNGADFTALFDPASSDINTINSLLGPSVNTGQVTKEDTRSDGTQVYEASSISSQGSSGGPIINTQGQIIGFVDAGPSTDRLTFLIPSEVIAKYTQQAGVSNPPQGQFMKLWTQATQDYDSTGDCHWHNAESDLQKLHTEYPLFGGEQQYLQKATTQAATETCASSSSSSGGASAFIILGGICLVGLLILAAVIFLIVFLVRRSRKPATQPALAPVAAGGAQYGSQYGAPMASQAPYTPNMPMSPMPSQASQAPQRLQGPQAPQPYQPQSPYSGAPNAPTVQVAPPPAQPSYQQPQPPSSAPPAGPAPVRVAGPQMPQSQPPMTPMTPMTPPAPQPLQGPQTPLPPYQPPYSAPQQPQQSYQAPYSAPQQPPYQPPYSAPQPQQSQQPPYAAPYGATPQGQAPTQPPTQPSTGLSMRYCVNGHAVNNPLATFCPVCGATIRPPDMSSTTTPNSY